MSIFSSWVSYFKDPVVIFGLVLLLAFLTLRFLLKFKVIKQLPEQFETGVPKMLLNYGFIVGLAVVFLGISLKQKELNQAEQINALMLLNAEFKSNVLTIKQLSQNNVDVLQAHRLVVDSLHSDGSMILSTIFPKLSRREKSDKAVSKQVTDSFEKLKSLRLLKSKSHMAAFNALKGDIKKGLDTHIQLLSDRQDKGGDLYVIEDEIWLGYQEIFDESDDFNSHQYEGVLRQMKTLRGEYAKTLRQTESYFLETADFMNRSTFLGNGDVYEILTKELKSEAALTGFVRVIRDDIKVFDQATSLFNLK